MRILLTGTSSFTGYWFVRELVAAGHEVVAACRGDGRSEALRAERVRMVRELCEALEVISQSTTLVLILEDLHWADPSTLDLISAIARRRESARLCLVGTVRPADLILSESPLKALKQDLLLHRLIEDRDLLPQLPPGDKQRTHDQGNIGSAVKERFYPLIKSEPPTGTG